MLIDDVTHGDCLDFLPKIKDNSVDLVLTDPPYEIQDMRPYFAHMKRVLKKSGSLYCFGDKNMIAEHWFSQLEIPHKELLIWYYKNSPKPRGRWRLSMQGIIYAYFDKKTSTFKQDEARVPYLPSTKKLHGRLRPSGGRLKVNKPYDTSKGALPRDVIEQPALLGHLAKERVGHRDQKPLALIEKLLKTSSEPGQLILDPFGGSGTTLIACLKNSRKCITTERNRSNFLMIKKRLSAFKDEKDVE